MSLYEWLLFLHVLTAFLLVAAVVLFTILIVGSRSRDVPGEVVRLFRVSRLGDVLVNVGGLGTLVFGVWLAIYVDGYELWDGWIIAALVLWAAFSELGRRTAKVYNAARDRARALVAEGREEPSAELNGMLRSPAGLGFHLATIVAALLLLADMIYKPGA